MKHLIVLIAFMSLLAVHYAAPLKITGIYMGPRQLERAENRYRSTRQRHVMPRMAWRSKKRAFLSRHLVPHFSGRRFKHPRPRYSRRNSVSRADESQFPISLFRQMVQARNYKSIPALLTAAYRTKKRRFSTRIRRMPSVEVVKRREESMCAWNMITSPEEVLLLRRLLIQYEDIDSYTVRDIVRASVRLGKSCTSDGCQPSHHEIMMDVTLAPTDGCNWRSQCECLPVPHDPGIKCTAKGIIPHRTKIVTDLEFKCNGVPVMHPSQFTDNGKDFNS